MGNKQEQYEELEVLLSIYGEEVFIVNESRCEGRFLVHPVLPKPFTILLHPEGGVKQELQVCYLPPIVLHFFLPEDYPSTRGPKFVLSCQWLTKTQLSSLCQQLDRLWHESQTEVVLFRWIQFLQEDALAHLRLHSHLDITPLVTLISKGNLGNLSQALKRMNSLSLENRDVKTRESQQEENNVSHKVPRIRSQVGITNEHLRSNWSEKERTTVSNYNCNRKGTERELGESERENRELDETTHELLPNDRIFSDEEVLENLKLCSFSCQEVKLPDQEDPRAVVDLIPEAPPLPIFAEFNESKQREAFDKEWFTCKVCLNENLGNQCLQFVGCHHVYCKKCMQIYFGVQIREGNVRLLTCPEEKCTSQATPAQVYELVGPDLYDRYDKILLESSLATMGDLTYCPRKSCQFMVIKDHSEIMAICDRCLFVFCHFCRKTYHGVAPCALQEEQKFQIVKDYQNANSSEKLIMEKRYGKQPLLTMIEDAMSEKWVKDYTKKCPRCSASIQKIDGCNKMSCWRCNSFFCWLCMKKLDPSLPYLHFNDTKSKCFNLLFEGTHAEDREDWEFGQFI